MRAAYEERAQSAAPACSSGDGGGAAAPQAGACGARGSAGHGCGVPPLLPVLILLLQPNISPALLLLPQDYSIKEGETLKLSISAPKRAGTGGFVSKRGQMLAKQFRWACTPPPPPPRRPLSCPVPWSCPAAFVAVTRVSLRCAALHEQPSPWLRLPAHSTQSPQVAARKRLASTHGAYAAPSTPLCSLILDGRGGAVAALSPPTRKPSGPDLPDMGISPGGSPLARQDSSGSSGGGSPLAAGRLAPLPLPRLSGAGEGSAELQQRLAALRLLHASSGGEGLQQAQYPGGEGPPSSSVSAASGSPAAVTAAAAEGSDDDDFGDFVST